MTESTDMPKMTCPQCQVEYDDYDGLGVLMCPACGFCRHVGRDNGICNYCGDRNGAHEGAGEPAPAQIGRLANFIMKEITGEPAVNQGAVDTAIRLLGAAYTGRVTVARVSLEAPPYLPPKPVPRLIGDLRRFVQWYGAFGVLEGLRHALNGAPLPEAEERVVVEHMAARELLAELAVLWTPENDGGQG